MQSPVRSRMLPGGALARQRSVSIYGRFLDTVCAEVLLEPGNRVLVALSGGADSVCLFDLLLAARRELGIEVRAMHVNHRLRSAAADDEAAVRRLCTERGVELTVARRDVRRVAAVRGLSLEEAGREVRYEELERAARRLGCHRVALGHNAEDNLETILLNIVRGTGLSGVAGIPVRRGVFIRPLLDIDRDSIRRHLVGRGIGWVEDESNRDPAFRRNLVRLQVLPALSVLNPAAAANARRLSRTLAAEDRFLDSRARECLDAVLCGPGRGRVDTTKLGRYDEVLQRRAFRLLFPALDMAAVDRALDLARGRTGRSADLGCGIRARRVGRELVFEMEDSTS